MAGEEDKFVRHFSRLGHATGESELRNFYKSIKDKSLVDKVLAQYGEPATQGVPQPNLASYKYSVGANLRVLASFEVHVELHIPSMSKVFSGDGGGALVGIGVSGGTLYYNDPNDLSGNSDWNANFFSVYANLNLIRNGVYATFSGGGIPLIGASGGSGKWEAES
jgi:hypothetical protein